jgi:ubiquinone/menaquinone biosynthesis C-methylase UbiE
MATDTFSPVSDHPVDWGSLGQYEAIAPVMLPAAEAVVDLAALQPGDRVLDVGTGSGNAALLAAVHRADVLGVDPSPRLLEVAAARATEAGVTVEFRQGTAENLPVPDASVDVILDVLSLMFVGDQAAAVAEMARVLAPTGRILWTSWVRTGTVVEFVKIHADAVEKRQGRKAYAYTQWHDPKAMDALFAPHGFEISITEHSMEYRAPSAQDFLDAFLAAHPLGVDCDNILRAAGVADKVNAQLLKVLEDGNEDPDAFLVTPHYIIGTARRTR